MRTLRATLVATCLVSAHTYRPYPRALAAPAANTYGQARSLRIRTVGQLHTVGEEVLNDRILSNRSYLKVRNELRNRAAAQAFATIVESAGPWKQVEETAVDNLCIEGRLLPEVFLLGAAKSATTSMAANLMGAGVEVSGPDCRGWCVPYEKHFAKSKELHYFDYKMSWQLSTLDDYDDVRHEWIGMYPECDQPSSRGARFLSRFFPRRFPQRKRLMADFTPEYLRMVPLPDGAIYDESSMVQQLSPDASPEAKARLNLPSVLKHFYGQAAPKLRFVVMLRQPLERMQSLYYCCLCPTDDEDPDPDCISSSFDQDLQRDLAKLTESPPKYSDWVWGSFYARHIERWLTHFKGSQFYTIPFRHFTDNDGDAVCGELSQHLAYSMECHGAGGPSTWLEHEHPHPPLRQDISETTRDDFEALMDDETARLTGVLAQVHQDGGILSGYDERTMGPATSATVKTWLTEKW